MLLFSTILIIACNIFSLEFFFSFLIFVLQLFTQHQILALDLALWDFLPSLHFIDWTWALWRRWRCVCEQINRFRTMYTAMFINPCMLTLHFQLCSALKLRMPPAHTLSLSLWLRKSVFMSPPNQIHILIKSFNTIYHIILDGLLDLDDVCVCWPVSVWIFQQFGRIEIDTMHSHRQAPHLP